MKAHAQARVLLGQGRGLRRGRTQDHQAGETQDALAVSAYDRGVDRGVEAEVVGRDDEGLSAHYGAGIMSMLTISIRHAAPTGVAVTTGSVALSGVQTQPQAPGDPEQEL